MNMADTELVEARHAGASAAIGVSGEADASDYVTPFLKLVQGLSAEVESEGSKPGQFYTQTWGNVDSVRFVVVHIAMTRTLYDKTEGLLCSSSDRVHGRVRKMELVDPLAGVSGALPALCQQCPHYQDDQYEKDSCKKDYFLTCFDVDRDEPFTFRVKGSSMGVFRNKIINAALRGKSAPWSATWEMKGARREKEGNRWYEPELTLFQMHDDETIEQWASYATQFNERVTEEDPDDLPFE